MKFKALSNIGQKKLAGICLLFVWALLQFQVGNKLYTISLVLLYIIFSIPRLRSFTLIAAYVLFLLTLKTPLLETMIEIKTINLDVFQSYKSAINNSFTPDSGREVLPGAVQQMLKLIETNSLPDYRLSSKLSNDPLIQQRIAESAWPIKMEPTSDYVFLLTTETMEKTCSEIDRKGNITLAYCP
jgi:hypothetical protein